MPALAAVLALIALSGCLTPAAPGFAVVLEPTSADDFRRILRKSKVPVLTAFVTDSCPSCHRIGPPLTSLATDYGQRLLVLKADLGFMGELIQTYDLLKVPTLVVFRDGVEVSRRRGMLPAGLMHGFIDHALAAPSRQ